MQSVILCVTDMFEIYLLLSYEDIHTYYVRTEFGASEPVPGLNPGTLKMTFLDLRQVILFLGNI